MDMFWNESFELKTVFESYKGYLFWLVDISEGIETCGPSDSNHHVIPIRHVHD